MASVKKLKSKSAYPQQAVVGQTIQNLTNAVNIDTSSLEQQSVLSLWIMLDGIGKWITLQNNLLKNSMHDIDLHLKL
ncbi:unnamed protein product [Parnassius mnemosyne]|uniref:Uncharacterized protein n=1 Tax=Parnassius mnemosyne TaxID=213953 RepID=A0AAV1KNG7_9NEOP